MNIEMNQRRRRHRSTAIRGTIVGAMLLAAAMATPGCRPADKNGGGDSESAGDGAKTIGVSLLTVQHQFYQDLRAGLEAAAKADGYELIVVSAEFDPARQANQVDEFIVQHVDAIVLCPSDSRSVGSSIVAANDAGIPVFTADIANTSPMGEVVSHIASDNIQGGREAAKLMATAINKKGKVAILSHPEVASVTDRVRGFKEQLKEYSGIELVAELSADGKRDKAVRVMEDLLQSNPDLNGVFGINDDSALGALAAVEAAGKTGQVAIIGYDATPEARTKIEAGAIYGDVIQNPRRIGELTIAAIHNYFENDKPEAVVAVEVGTFTRESK